MSHQNHEQKVTLRRQNHEKHKKNHIFVKTIYLNFKKGNIMEWVHFR